MMKQAFTFKLVQRPLLVASLAATTFLLSNGGSKAQTPGPGDLDQTFGVGGKLLNLTVGQEGVFIDGVEAVLVQPDGKILFAGSNPTWLSGVTRLLPDGTFDKGFGVPGLTYASSLLLLPDGMIVVGGAFGCSGPWPPLDDCHFGLAWFAPDGTGYVQLLTTSFNTSAGVNSLTLQNDTIVAAGGPYLARYVRSAPGGPFLLESTVTTDMTRILTVVVQPDGTSDGKLVASGLCGTEGTCFACMARFRADGSVDSEFGTNGWVTDLAPNAFSALALQSDGKLVVAGGSGDFVLARYSSDGLLDGTFGAGGTVSTDFGNYDVATAIATQPGGKLIVAGVTAALDVAQFALARYDVGGTLDSTFGNAGKVTTFFEDGPFTFWEATRVAVQPDGKVIAAGFGRWRDLDIRQGVVARYLGGDVAPLPAPSNLVASALTDSRIDVTWSDNSDREDRFEVERCTGTATWCTANPEFSPIASVGTNVTSFSDTSLSADTTFSYRVRAATNSGDASPYSNIDDAVTTAGVDLVESAVSNPPSSVRPGESFSVTDTVTNQGGETAVASVTRYYLSLDAVKSASDIALTGTRAVPTLDAGAVSTGTATVKLPTSAALGTYFLLACADATALVAESNESNNCRAAETSVLVSRPDLIESAIGDPPAVAQPGGSVTVSDTARNVGEAPAPTTATRYYLSVDTAKGTGDILLSGSRAVPALSPSAESAGGRVVTLPTSTPLATYYLLACADDAKGVQEFDETNNCRASSGRVVVTRPNLVTSSVNNPPAQSAPGRSFSALAVVVNTGDASASKSTLRYYLSVDAARNAEDWLLKGARSVGVLEADGSSSGTTSVTVPTTIPTGAYRLLACADDTARVTELDESDNCLASAGVVDVLYPDLVQMSVSNPPSSALIGGSFTVTDTVSNQGAIATVTTATTRYFLSLDQSMDASDVRLGYRNVAPLAVGASSTGARTLTIPAMVSGIYYLFACADDGTSIVESNEANNCRPAPATVAISTTSVTDQP